MTPFHILLGIGAGLVSAVVFASATTGPIIARLALFVLTPFSLFLAGLAVTPWAAAIGGVVATALILFLSTPTAALVYAVSQAFPAVLLTRIAGFHREGADGAIWYPVGRLVIVSAILAGLFVLLALTLLGSNIDALQKSLREGVELFVKTELAGLPNAPQLTPGDIDQITRTVMHTLPGAAALSAMATTLVNLWLAGRIARSSGGLLRPWPDLSALTFPRGTALAFAAALGLSFSGGMTGLIGSGFAGAFFLAFVLLGLAVVHYVSDGSPWRPFVLAIVYASLLVFGLIPAVIIAVLGLAETFSSFRSNTTSPGPDDTNSSPPLPPA